MDINTNRSKIWVRNHFEAMTRFVAGHKKAILGLGAVAGLILVLVQASAGDTRVKEITDDREHEHSTGFSETVVTSVPELPGMLLWSDTRPRWRRYEDASLGLAFEFPSDTWDLHSLDSVDARCVLLLRFLEASHRRPWSGASITIYSPCSQHGLQTYEFYLDHRDHLLRDPTELTVSDVELGGQESTLLEPVHSYGAYGWTMGRAYFVESSGTVVMTHDVMPGGSPDYRHEIDKILATLQIEGSVPE